MRIGGASGSVRIGAARMEAVRFSKVLFLCFFVGGLACAQSPEEAQVVQARATVERIRGLVDAGTLPPVELQKAEDALGDAQDAAILRKDILQQDLTAAQADELVGAADRQFERRKRAFDNAKDLVEQGLEPRLSLDTYLREQLSRELTEEAEAERLYVPPVKAEERFDASGPFTEATFQKIESAFEAHFGKPMPVSAMGETAVHRALGFDHRGRVDVSIHPDQPEGVWLREYLTENHIPFFAFRHAVPGKATGAHIHLGPGSTRLLAGE
jgi:hypothetical protein